MARIGAAAVPAVGPPRALRPFVRFTRLPDHALVAVRRALDEDEAFRARVEVLADEAELGRAGWLFVARPEGWEAEFDELAGAEQSRADAEREAREERSARRRLTAAEAATERAEAAAARMRAEAAAAAAELATERRERRAAQEEASRLARRVASLEGERDSARRRAAEAVAAAEVLRTELEAVRAELRTRVEDVERLVARRPPEPVAAPVTILGDSPRPTTGFAPALDVDAVAGAVASASAAAAALGRALAEASAALRPAAGPSADDGPQVGAAGAPAVPSPGGRGGPRRPSARRRPAALPPAVFDDTVEAAAHLIRVPGVLVLVDGYNVAKAVWPDVAPLELRERLVDALSEHEARTGAEIHVVFDGADLGGPLPRAASRRHVRVTFSPADVEADDVILDLVDAEPAPRPVVVASSDRRVQDGARTRGANVISSPQLAAVLGRA